MNKEFLKKIKLFIFFLLLLLFLPKKTIVLSENTTPTLIQTINIVTPSPIPCQNSSGCPIGITPSLGYTCAISYEDWLQDKTKNYWVNDEEITYLGKQGERARQFTYWVLTHKSIDNAPNITRVWQQNRNIVYVFIILISAIFGINLMIQKRYFQASNIDIKDKILKVGLLLLYATFSFSLTLFIIQISDLLSNFFIETLGVDKIFNIFFLPIDQTGTVIQKSEQAYLQFQGCRNLNINLTETIKTAIFLIKTTNLTYFLLGIMLLLRKIILWSLLVLSPFLAIFIPFTFIRNIGWIWIGVFFQWVFYGPLVSLFLGLLATIWNNAPNIPFNFDFSRINRPEGFIYQTGINILYGGPAQTLTFSNTSNYIDTFAEYVISLLMLWVTIFFPWWLLRIFRDYCCDGIYATKNILLSIYDQLRGGPSPTPTLPSPSPLNISTSLKIPKGVEIPVKVKLETIEEIKKAKTEEITRSLNISVSKLTDIAHFETNKQLKETVTKNINYLQNPTQAQTPTERQKFMYIRNELFKRAIKEDKIAKQILSTISTSKIQQQQVKEKIIKTIPQAVPATHIVSYKTKIPHQTITNITTSVLNTAQLKTNLINNIASTTNLPANQIKNVINSIAQNVNQPITNIIEKTAKENNLEKRQVKTIIKTFSNIVKENKELIREVAQQNKLEEKEVEKVIENQIPVISEPERHIESTILIPPSVSIEEYEEVKKMWINQYEKGEIPVSENITSRKQWLENDIIYITNTLNKLLSSDEKLKQEGLEDVGYILPIFLINNLTGEQLLVYLKAKLEAAKQILEQKQKEEELMEKLKEKQEEIEVPLKRKKEEEKVLQMEQEIEFPKEENSQKTFTSNESTPENQQLNPKNGQN